MSSVTRALHPVAHVRKHSELQMYFGLRHSNQTLFRCRTLCSFQMSHVCNVWKFDIKLFFFRVEEMIHLNPLQHRLSCCNIPYTRIDQLKAKWQNHDRLSLFTPWTKISHHNIACSGFNYCGHEEKFLKHTSSALYSHWCDHGIPVDVFENLWTTGCTGSLDDVSG